MAGTAPSSSPIYKNYETIAQTVLPNQLDCFTWNPTHHNLFVIGTYEIDKEDSERRLGKILLSRLIVEPAQNSDDNYNYKIVHTVDNLPGILDLKWESNEGELLAVASSASASIYKLCSDKDNDTLIPINCVPLSGKLEMALYKEWMDSTNLIFTTSTGMINLWNIEEFKNQDEGSSSQLRSIQPHQYFVWFVHYDKESKIIYSGDDSGMMCVVHMDNFELGQEGMTKKQFDTGVTSILTNDGFLFVGCYDEKLRIFPQTIRDFDKKIILPRHPIQEIDFGGTVWRMIRMPQSSQSLVELAIAAGRNGIHFITLNPAKNWECKTELTVLEYQGDLAYGLDVKICKEDDNENSASALVGTCYFDSKRLHIFKLNIQRT